MLFCGPKQYRLGVIEKVDSDSPAHRAGVRVDKGIVAVNGHWALDCDDVEIMKYVCCKANSILSTIHAHLTNSFGETSAARRVDKEANTILTVLASGLAHSLLGHSPIHSFPSRSEAEYCFALSTSG